MQILPRIRFKIWHAMLCIGIIAAALPFLTNHDHVEDQEIINHFISNGAFHLQCSLNNAEQVERLNFSLTDFDNVWWPQIEKLDSLRELELRGHEINSFGLDHLLKLHLDRLDIRDTNLTSEQVEDIQERLPNCQIKYSYRKFTDYHEYFIFRQSLRAEELKSTSLP
ncbi:hypothetical protein Pan97_23360 [Bremerella volcania]|uniref:Leucine Rich repeats (2 copies) n=1 Tax=Bremerella volcania TaxID=2527984 RepID=A0A518C7U7_9BACT|nr:hypothetical protein Pan97_23360 [Bremerella volcania]